MAAHFEPPAPPAPEQPPVALAASYQSDLNADVSGGARRGAAYLGKLALIADADLERLVGLPAGTAHASVLNIHGTGLSGAFVGNLATVSGLEAEPATRLNQLWIELPLGRGARLRLGKFPAAQRFMASDTAALFVNATFGWPAAFAANLPSGGPAWPLAAPGAMLSLGVGKRLSLAGAVFAGDPAGPGTGDSQRRDGHGFNGFGFAGQPFAIAQGDFHLGGATVSLGGWIHFDRFAPVDGLGADRPRNWSLYALADAPLWQRGPRRLSGFARLGVSPPDRDAVPLYFDMGLQLTAPLEGRPRDAIGIAYAWAGLSRRLGTPDLPAAEQIVELSYRAALTPAIALQPNVQLILDPVAPDFSARAANALVVGLRTSVSL